MQFILSTRKEDSYDDKALTKSAFLLTQNPDIYTLWNYRKEVILMKIKERYCINNMITNSKFYIKIFVQ